MSSRAFTFLVGLATMTFSAFVANGETILIDDFNDGNDDGWTHIDMSAGTPWGPGIYDASTGAYQLQTTGVLPRGLMTGLVNSIWNRSFDPIFSNGRLRATIRAGNEGSGGGVMLRFNGQNGPPSGYIFAADPAAGNFFFNTVVNGSFVREEQFSVPGFPVVPGDDWIVEASAVHDQITMKVWPLGQAEPQTPQLILTDSRVSSGLLGLTAGVNLELQEPWQTHATFDNVTFTANEPCDLNGDGICDLGDIDLLGVEVATGGNGGVFDLSSDGNVDRDDVNAFLGLVNRLNGDADFNGKVEFRDFTILAGNFGQTNKRWSDGDFDTNAEIQFHDFLILATNFDQGGDVAAVPEPSSAALVVVAGLLFGLAFRHQRNPST